MLLENISQNDKSLLKTVGFTSALFVVTAASSTIVANAQEVEIQPGETLSILAERHSTTVEELKEINNLEDEDLIIAHENILVERVDGDGDGDGDGDVDKEVKEDKTEETYVVQSGDTLGSIADKYGVDYKDIMRWNNLETDVILTGEELIIYFVEPVVEQPVVEEVSYDYSNETNETNETNKNVAQAAEIDYNTYDNTYSSNETYVENTNNNQTQYASSPSYDGSYNPYPTGECVTHAFDRRAQLGKGVSGSWGNASNWASVASSQGYEVNNSPSQGAIIQTGAYQNGSGWAGHVGVVESVNNDGSITISESNWNGNRFETFRTIPASQVSSYNYIH